MALVAAGCFVAALAAAGCSREEEAGVPVGCREGPAAVRSALARAPARVELGDGTPLSECFARGSDAADVQQVGGAWVGAATGLAADARARPDGPAAVRLGYLVGAARRGASDTQGIHDELIRRLDQELIGMDTGTPAYRRGYEAARSGG